MPKAQAHMPLETQDWTCYVFSAHVLRLYSDLLNSTQQSAVMSFYLQAIMAARLSLPGTMKAPPSHSNAWCLEVSGSMLQTRDLPEQTATT